MQIQQEAAQTMDLAMEGSDRYDGLREVLDIVYAGETKIGYIPWWEQKVRFIEPGRKIELALPYNAAGGVPVAQVYDSDKKEYRFTEIDFYSGKEEFDKNHVSFRDKALHAKRGRIFFYPQYRGNPDVMMTLYWDNH